MGEVLIASASHSRVNPYHFPLKSTQTLHLQHHTKKYQFGSPPQYGTGVLYYKERCILLLKCFNSFPRWYIMQMEGASNSIFQLHGSNHAIYHWGLLSNCTQQIVSFVAPLSKPNRMLHYKKRHPLLVNCFKTFHRYMRRLEEAFGITRQQLILMGHTVSSSPNVGSQITHKLWDLEYALSKVNGILYYNEIPPLIVYCLITSMSAYGRYGELLTAYTSRLCVTLFHFTLRLTLKLHTKCQFCGTLSIRHMECCTARKDIHCLWIVSNPSLGA